ncbi:MAG: hypothetical protein J3K34DRAFT_434423 [Monoraphidium minutum]|nr:MAG: hypothetical protein J3K34DRAFT_434423 [Monoraphidium minutum]
MRDKQSLSVRLGAPGASRAQRGQCGRAPTAPRAASETSIRVHRRDRVESARVERAQASHCMAPHGATYHCIPSAWRPHGAASHHGVAWHHGFAWQQLIGRRSPKYIADMAPRAGRKELRESAGIRPGYQGRRAARHAARGMLRAKCRPGRHGALLSGAGAVAGPAVTGACHTAPRPHRGVVPRSAVTGARRTASTLAWGSCTAPRRHRGAPYRAHPHMGELYRAATTKMTTADRL